MDNIDTRVSKILLYAGLLGGALNLADSVRTRGPLRAAALFALSTGLPAFGEVLVTGPLKLLRHRTNPRVKGVPVTILLLWYNVICGAHAATERALNWLPLTAGQRRETLPPGTALVATSLDLVLDPFGLDAGLWEWKVDGAYATEVRGANGRRGVPLLNYLGWVVVVMGVVLGYARLFPRGGSGSRLPALLLLPHYLASAGWAVKRRKPGYLLYSALFPAVLYLGTRNEGKG
ncbi:MAG: carotenoid biosynthesis protein [Actinomycetota bacterium]|nr:carotenoid biosynthesis protein [Actinomycetota bacterium]